MKERRDKGPVIGGLHHVTALAGEPAGNLAFYREVMGQRLVKRTVNFDDPGTWHLYYGDLRGRPGTALTFFPHPGIPRGRPGAGSVTRLAWSVPSGSLGYWGKRLESAGVKVSGTERFGERVLEFADPEGFGLALVETEEPLLVEEWSGSPVPWERALRGFHGVTALVHEAGQTEEVLTGPLGYRLVAEDGPRRRFASETGAAGSYVELLTDPTAPRVRQGAGIMHHIAFSTPDEESQREIRQQLIRNGYGVSEVRDRQYFKSIYFNEPNGILFEVATEGPGFTVDEPVEDLGSSLRLPPAYASWRERIETDLPSLEPEPSDDKDPATKN